MSKKTKDTITINDVEVDSVQVNEEEKSGE